MPNNTYTEVTIQGPPLTIKDMGSHLAKTAIPNPRSTVPMPGFLATYLGDPSNGPDDPDWYDKRIKAWGTKWDIYDVQNVQTDYVAAHGGFEESRILKCVWHTAWSPCIAAMLKLSKDYKVDITLRYVDEGYLYVGSAVIIDGELNNMRDYSKHDVYTGIWHVFGKEAFNSEMELLLEHDRESAEMLVKSSLLPHEAQQLLQSMLDKAVATA